MCGFSNMVCKILDAYGMCVILLLLFVISGAAYPYTVSRVESMHHLWNHIALQCHSQHI